MLPLHEQVSYVLQLHEQSTLLELFISPSFILHCSVLVKERDQFIPVCPLAVIRNGNQGSD